jgi:histidine triad (HIT) family protein
MSQSETVFSKIIRKEIPAKVVYEDDLALAFHDISPKAPVHVLVIPKKPIVSLEDVAEEDQALVGHLFLVLQKVARQLDIADDGYRVVINCREHGGQEVPHLHLHLLGGRKLGWPPG